MVPNRSDLANPPKSKSLKLISLIDSEILSTELSFLEK